MACNRQKAGYVVLALLFFLLGMGLASLLPGETTGIFRTPLLPDAPRLTGKNSVPTAMTPVRVSTQTEVVYHIQYEKCRHSETRVLPEPPLPMVGLQMEDIRLVYPKWQVREFTAKRLVLVTSLPEMCPDDIRFRTITLRDNKVVVLHGSGLHADSPVMARTSIDADRLSKADYERLTRGIVVTSDQEVEDWLEGILE